MPPKNDRFRVFVIVAKCIALVIVPFLAVGFWNELVESTRKIDWTSTRFLGFVAGFVLFLPTWWIANTLLWRPLQFVCTLEHEITHAIVGLPFLFVPNGMRVTATEGGHVKQIWKGPSWLAPLYGAGIVLSGLAPYYLPTTSYILIVASWLFLPQETRWFAIVLGFLTSFHICSTWVETRFRQPDIQDAGRVFSMLFLPVANLLALGGIFAFVIGGNTGFARFWRDGIVLSLVSVSDLASWIAHLKS